MKEWKQIPGYMRYEINPSGIVRRIRDQKSVPWSYCTNGYPQVSVNNDLLQKSTRLVHILVAITFLRPLIPGEEINHKDGRRNNPRLDNIEIMASKAEHMKKHRNGWHPCAVCGEEIPPPRRCCSKECHHATIWTKRECVMCGQIFEVRKSTIKSRLKDVRYKKFAVYCSRNCFLSDTQHFAKIVFEYRHNNRRLSFEQYHQVRSLLNSKITIADISRMYGVSRGVIKSIKYGKTYHDFNTPNTPGQHIGHAVIKVTEPLARLTGHGARLETLANAFTGGA